MYLGCWQTSHDDSDLRREALMMPADVAVVVVNTNGREHIDRCLASLRHQTVPPRRTIVVDNASSDGSPEWIAERYPDVELVRSERNVGFAAANNLGARVADDCEFLALLNPDAFAEPAWLETLVRAARDYPDFTFFASRMVQAMTPDRLDGTGDVYHVGGLAWRRDWGRPVQSVHRPREEVFSACAGAALYRRDAFVSVGGFDERFFVYHEDTDLSFRLRLRGERCLYVSDAVVAHVGFGTNGQVSDFTIYHSHRNSVWTFVKNMPRPLFWRYLPQHFAVNLLEVATSITHRRGRAGLRAKRDAIRGLPEMWRSRRAIQASRQAHIGELRGLMATGRETAAMLLEQRRDERRARTG